MPRPKGRPSDTRTRILAAAADEFGAHGFAATTIDRIAARARVNKAMIYYHFPDKRALYACILRDVFTPITERLHAVMAQQAPPDRTLDRLIEAIVESIDESTLFLPILLREIADGGAHLGAEELALIAGLFAVVSGVIADGARQQQFQPVHPALAHFTIVAPLLMFRAAAPVRARIRNLRHVDIPEADSATLVRHLQMVARRMLAREPTRESPESRESRESRESPESPESPESRESRKSRLSRESRQSRGESESREQSRSRRSGRGVERRRGAR
jgi:AcrR family transcriptional regulator